MGSHMSNFTVVRDQSVPPWEDTVKVPRLKVIWRGRAITALSQSDYRAYLYPVFTPAGVPVTAEAPADHPHHQSITVGTDRLDCIIELPEPYSNTFVEATHNFWSNETFSGRAPSRIISKSVEDVEISDDHLRLVQKLEWQGPPQWGESDSVVVADETRTIDVFPGQTANIIDVRSQLKPTKWDLRIGPTVHAYFTVRLADGLRVVDGGTLVDSERQKTAKEIRGQCADWVDGSGKASHGYSAGVAVFKHPSMSNSLWHLDDWGKLSLNPFISAGEPISRGEALDLSVRIVAHDGDVTDARIDELYVAFMKSL